MNIPDEKINFLADNLEAGERCFVHKETLDIVTYPEDLGLYEWEEDPDENPWKEEINKVNADPDNYIEIEKMNSTESYRVMEAFINSLPASRTKALLPKP
jgi:hypothetical protein